MPRVRRSTRPRRRPRRLRRVRRARRGGTGARLRHKVYSYVFHPATQFIASTNIAGVPAVSGGSAPITIAQVGTPGLAPIGFTDTYSFGVGTAFQLTDCANFAQFTQLYDQFKIMNVSCKVTYLQNQAVSGTANILPSLYSYIDIDNAVIPTEITQVEGRPGVKVTHFGNMAKTVTGINVGAPMLANTVNATSATFAFTGYGSMRQWCDCANPTQAWYGLKMWVENMKLSATAGVNSALQFNWTYKVAFRGALRAY